MGPINNLELAGTAEGHPLLAQGLPTHPFEKWVSMANWQGPLQNKNPKNSQHRDQQLPYFISVNSNVTDNYSASVLIGDLSP